jgi:phosphoglycerate dehydrogenase-like enzyme
MAEGATAVMVSGALVSAEIMDRLPDLKVIGRYGIGVDNIDMRHAEERDIAVVSAPGFCAREVADHTMAMLLTSARRLPFLNTAILRGEWPRVEASPMPALYSQTLGLLGFGEIGRQVAARARSFGLTVAACDPVVDPAAMREAEVTPMRFEELLARADYLSLHLPLIPATRHVIGRAELAAMKPSATIINTSRGPLIDEEALADALQSGKLRYAALDVFETEPLPSRSPLAQLPNVLLTPHVAGLSDDGQELCRRIVATGVANVIAALPH